MDSRLIALIAIAVAIAAGLTVLWSIARKQRSARLPQQFGSEYDRTERMTGTRKAEILLMEHGKQVETYRIRQLDAEEREMFTTEWRAVQSRFVDDPRDSVDQADLLVVRLMQTRGYPVTSFEQRGADISVTHAGMVGNYRAAHQIALRRRQGLATTEDLRNAIIYYRSLFNELLQADSVGPYRRVA